jgi:hypothetical protein
VDNSKASSQVRCASDTNFSHRTNISVGPSQFLDLACLPTWHSLSLTSSQTANLDGRYVYDITANTANTTIRIQEGIVTVNPGVTR